MKFCNSSLKQKKGFTLIELLVTITIFVILTGVVLFSQTGFNNTILLKSLAYDVALTIRQAQDYGVNVNESKTLLNPFAPFGVYFNLNTTSGLGNIHSFIFFTDTENKNFVLVSDGMYNNAQVITCTSGDPECISKYNIGNGNYINGICVTNGSSCAVGPKSSDTQVTNGLDILFTRPNPNAKITTFDSSNNNPVQYNYADIQVSSANGQTKDIIVTSVGQIYVQ